MIMPLETDQERAVNHTGYLQLHEMGIYSSETWKQNTSRTITSNNIAHNNPAPYTLPQYIYKYTTKLLYDRSEKPQLKVVLHIVL